MLQAITFLSALKQTRHTDDVTEETMTFVFLVSWTTRKYNNGAIKMTIDTTFGSFPRACLWRYKQQLVRKTLGLWECDYIKGHQKM
jgi:hypothetical protein